MPITALLINDNFTKKDITVYQTIKGLSKKGGYCFATNKYLCEILNMKKRNLQKYLQKLKSYGLIIIDISMNYSQTVRKIYLMPDEKKAEFYPTKPEKKTSDKPSLSSKKMARGGAIFMTGGDALFHSENDTNKISYIRKTNKQAVPAVAASFKKEKTARPTKEIYASLKTLYQLPSNAQYLTDLFSEEDVNHAVAFIKSKKPDEIFNLQGLLLWACRTRPQIPLTIDQIIEDNKAYAKKIQGSVELKKGSYFEVLNKYAEIGITAAANYHPKCLNYESKNFKVELDNSLLNFYAQPRQKYAG